MHSTLFAITLFFALAVLHVRADFTTYTPVLTQVSGLYGGSAIC